MNDPVFEFAARESYETLTRDYSLISPLFGGGVQAGIPDTAMPIRGTSIRGQLRFWWRAIYWKDYPNYSEMLKAEQALWGSANGQASQVSIEVQIQDKGKPTNYDGFSPTLKYGAFPLQTADHKNLVEKVAFALQITFPKEQSDVLSNTLWAFETFGGIGARTRRGFGAFARENASSTAASIETKLKTIFQSTKGWKPRFAHLSAEVKLKVLNSDHEALLNKYKNFRQARTNGRGRSFWCEPDAIREITGASSGKHKTPFPYSPAIRKFPRAAFGLPILFHFKDKDDPKDTTLNLAGKERWASPLILKPLSKNQSLAVILDHAPLSQLGELRIDGKVEYKLSPEELKVIQQANYLKLSDQNVLISFLATL